MGIADEVFVIVPLDKPIPQYRKKRYYRHCSHKNCRQPYHPGPDG